MTTLTRFRDGMLLLLSVAISGVACAAQIVSIAVDTANMRSGPSTRYEIRFELGRGYPLEVIGKRGQWLKVRDFEGDVGWVHRRLAGRTQAMIVKSNRANLRSGPGTRYPVIASADYGEVFKTLERSGKWVRVQLPERRKAGWIARTLLWGW